MKILIIDDEYTIRHGIATVIRKYNERWTIVGEASGVSQALSIIRQERPDVIFLDIKMPGKSGIDLLREIQEIPLKMIPVIISGYSDFVYAQQALRYGAFDYIMKPVSPGKIIDVLCELEKKIISDQFLADELEAYHKSKEDRKIQFIQNLITKPICQPNHHWQRFFQPTLSICCRQSEQHFINQIDGCPSTIDRGIIGFYLSGRNFLK